MFKSIDKKELVDHEIELYRRERILDLDRNLNTRKEENWEELNNLRVHSIKENKQLEHDFHQGKEQKNVELAKLDAQIENKKSIFQKIGEFESTKALMSEWKAKSEANDKIILSKDREISNLNEMVKVIVGKLSKLDIGTLGINVTANKDSK